MFEKFFDIPSMTVRAICAGDECHHSVIIVLHGLGCSAETQVTELERLASEGFFAISLDAPHHGNRYNGLVGLIERCDGLEKHYLLMACEQQFAVEVSRLIKFLRADYQKISVMGISMGGYTTYALLRMYEKPDLFAPFLASPDFRYFNPETPTPSSPAELSGPTNFYKDIFPESLFMVNAGQDSVVNPIFARRFYEKLLPLYKEAPDKLEYHEYPESDHIMRPEDWFDAWDKFVVRLKREGF